jgi:hypothetical protein
MTSWQPEDNCGECCTADSVITVRPHRVRPDDASTGIVADYRCPRCGHSWWASWLASEEQRARPGEAISAADLFDEVVADLRRPRSDAA